MNCPICTAGTLTEFRLIDSVQYFECTSCGSLTADPQFLKDVEAGVVKNYHSDYWQMEDSAARERSYGSSLCRVAELFLYSRKPIARFVDIGSGPGHLLDAVTRLMPDSSSIFHAVEMFPPKHGYRTSHPNYMEGSIGQSPFKFDAGTCIEVIEHLTPSMLNGLVKQLSTRATDGSIFYFGSGQPAYVKAEDPEYLDPYNRGHIISYSLRALSNIFGEHGFAVTPLPGRDWAFLAEFGATQSATADDLMNRLWTPCKENVERLRDKSFGPLMYSIGIESARCYLEHHLSTERAQWVNGLDQEVQRLREQLTADAHVSDNVPAHDAGAATDSDEHVPVGVSH